MDSSTYNDHHGAMAIDFYGHSGVKTRLVVTVQVREEKKEFDISYPLALFGNYHEITRAVLHALGYNGVPGVIGCGRHDDDPNDWEEHLKRDRACNNIGNGRCYVKGHIFGKLKSHS